MRSRLPGAPVRAGCRMVISTSNHGPEGSCGSRHSLWAIIVIVVQLYLFAHLYEFRGRLQPEDPGGEVAWLGVYTSTLVRGLLLGTLVVLGYRGLLLLADYTVGLGLDDSKHVREFFVLDAHTALHTRAAASRVARLAGQS
jgi:hypothetical protein